MCVTPSVLVVIGPDVGPNVSFPLAFIKQIVPAEVGTPHMATTIISKSNPAAKTMETMALSREVVVILSGMLSGHTHRRIR